LCGIACLVIADCPQRYLAFAAFIAYAIGDVLLELIGGSVWQEICGVASFVGGHCLIIAATFIKKKTFGILRIPYILLVAMVIFVVVIGLMISCKPPYFLLLAETGYMFVLLFMIICVMDISCRVPSFCAKALWIGSMVLAVSDSIAFSRALCGVPRRVLLYNALEMSIYYSAITCMGIGCVFMPQWS
jgi:hypothetical protein